MYKTLLRPICPPTEMCTRAAGLAEGTPMAKSCSYAPLTDIDRLTQAEADAAIDAGKFILIHDGVKGKAGRGINNLTTFPGGRTVT